MRSAIVVAHLLGGSMLFAACGETDLSVTGAVQVTVALGPNAPQSIGGSAYRVRLVGADGTIREWEMEWPGGVGPAVAVAPGAYRAEIWTVAYSDAIMCQADPAAPEGQRCTRDEFPDRRCGLDIDVGAGTTAITYRSGERDWDCVLDADAAST